MIFADLCSNLDDRLEVLLRNTGKAANSHWQCERRAVLAPSRHTGRLGCFCAGWGQRSAGGCCGSRITALAGI